MAVIKSMQVVSDASGKVLEDPYQVGVFFDNVMYTVDLDRTDLVAELDKLSLLDVLYKKHKVKGARFKSLPRNTKASLKQMLHHQARKWAEEEGLEVGRRGVVSKEIMDHYHESKGIEPLDELLTWLEEEAPAEEM